METLFLHSTLAEAEAGQRSFLALSTGLACIGPISNLTVQDISNHWRSKVDLSFRIFVSSKFMQSYTWTNWRRTSWKTSLRKRWLTVMKTHLKTSLRVRPSRCTEMHLKTKSTTKSTTAKRGEGSPSRITSRRSWTSKGRGSRCRLNSKSRKMKRKTAKGWLGLSTRRLPAKLMNTNCILCTRNCKFTLENWRTTF